MVACSLIPLPLTRRNSLVNRVKFLGLAHTFTTVSPSNILHQTLSRDNVERELLRNNYQSYNLICPDLLLLALLLVLRTRNNTYSNKLTIFSSIALYCGDTYILCVTFPNLILLIGKHTRL